VSGGVTHGRSVAALFLLAPLLGGCWDDALVPELRGKWFSTEIARIKAQKVQRMAEAPAFTVVDECSMVYLVFRKRGIMFHAFGRDTPLFEVASVERDGWRLILTGTSKLYGDASPDTLARIELRLYRNEVRFENVFDANGRNMSADRIPSDHDARRLGTGTVGEVLKMTLDAKPCRAGV
jgi:hypothetical protein